MPRVQEHTHLAEFRDRFRSWLKTTLQPGWTEAIGGTKTQRRASRRSFGRERTRSKEERREVLRTSVAERVLGLPREPEVDRNVAWKDVKRS